MNLTERAETKREAFYKLTNSADVPEAPSGNRNLILYSADPWGAPQTGYYQYFGTAKTNETYDGAVVYKTGGVWNRLGINLNNHLVERGLLKVGDVLTYSVLAKTDQETPIKSVLFVRYNNQSGTEDITGKTEIINLTNEWQKVSVTFTVTEKMLSEEHRVNYLGWEQTTSSESGKYVYYTCNKIECGNVDTPYSQAPEDLGWSIDTLVPTQEKRYLWKFEFVYYSDGSVEVTQPVNLSIAGERGPQGIQGPKGDQGLPGEPGEDGRTQYTHIAYADNATGGGFSQTDQNKAYIGMYVDFTATDSNDPTRYKWSKWKGSDGAQGIPGKPGADGRTPYIHFAYADDDKGTNFSLIDKNQQYQGYYSDYTEADSTDYRNYKWVDRLANVQAGVRNLIVQSTAQKGLRLTMGAEPSQDQNHSLTDWIAIEPNAVYTLTCYEDVPEEKMWYSMAWYSTSNNDYSGWIDRPTGAATAGSLKGGKQYRAPANAKYAKVSYPTKYAKVKLERGNISTDYTQADEDTQDQIDNKADSVLTQEQLNAIAEKNALIQAEMEAKASMDTVNQWITAYQNYVNANEADKKKSEQALQDASNRLLQVKYDVNDLKQQWNFIDTYMSVQNEGLIIGKSDGSAYAKFSNDRISLFSGNSEVMYISQGTLNIANGIFTKTIQIGRFRFETHPNDADMLIIRFLGG